MRQSCFTQECSECEEQDLNLRTTKDQPLKLASLAT